MKRVSWDAIIQRNICITGVTEGGKRRERGRDMVEEIIDENFLDLRRDLDIQLQEAQKNSSRIKLKGPTLKYTTIKLSKVKQSILKLVRKVTCHLQGGSY